MIFVLSLIIYRSKKLFFPEIKISIFYPLNKISRDKNSIIIFDFKTSLMVIQQ